MWWNRNYTRSEEGGTGGRFIGLTRRSWVACKGQKKRQQKESVLQDGKEEMYSFNIGIRLNFDLP